MQAAENRMVDVGGVDLHCRVDGKPGARWLVFSNSLMTNLYMWDAQVEALEQDYRILRYDQRGHGDSDLPRDPCDFDTLANDVIQLMDDHNIGHATLIGISMGAATMLRAAQLNPGRVKSLVLCDGAAATPAGGAAAWDERIALVNVGGMDALVEPTVNRWFLPGFVAEGSLSLNHVRGMIMSTELDGFKSCVSALQDYDFRDGLHKMYMPAQLIAGAADGNMPTAMRQMAEAMPKAEFSEIANAGHLPCIEQPEAFNAVLKAFLAQHG